MSSKVGAQHLFIGPGSDQSTLVTISDSLTDSVVVAVDVVTVAEKRVNGKLEAVVWSCFGSSFFVLSTRIGQDFEI